jgi:hypothetical protein
LRRFQVWWFRVGIAEQILPDLCGRLERARELAMEGRTFEAGKKYQAVLVASQVMHFAIAMHAVAQQAEIAGQPGGQVTQTIARFADQAKPIYDAALSEDPQRIAHAFHEHPEVFKEWADCLEQWPARINDGVERVKVAKLVWDISFLVVATYQAAGAAAEMAAAGRPPMPPMPAAFALGGGATAAGFSEVASIELAEAIRRLIAAGALDAMVVAALSHSLGSGPSSGTPLRPGTLQMSSADQPPGSASASNAPAVGGGGRATELLRPGGRLIGLAGTSSRIRILQGGQAEAEALFGQLSKGGQIIEGTSYPGTLVRLPGGGQVGFRPSSASGPPTIDVTIEGLGIREIKFLP